MLVLVAVSLTALLMFCGLSIDVGFWYQRRAQVQMNADLAAMTSLAANDASQPYQTQTTFVNSIASGIMTKNGYSASSFTVSVQPDNPTTPTRVSTVTVTVTQQVPTFFWHVLSSATPTMSTMAVAEGDKVLLPLPPCTWVAVDHVATAVDGTGTSGTVDSYNQNTGYNPSLNSFPSCGGTTQSCGYQNANATGCANGSISDQHKNAGSLYSSLGNVQAGTVVGSDYAAGTASGSATGTENSNVKNLPVFSLPPVPNPAETGSGSFGTPCVAGNAGNPSCTPISAAYNDNSTITGGSGPGSTAWTGGEKLVCGKNYYVTSIKMNGGQNIVVANSPNPPCDPNNPVRVYVNGGISISGLVGINVAGVPSDITIYGISTDPSNQLFDLGGNDNENMNVYAPAYEVNMHGQGREFGDVNANTIDLKGVGGFSYDEALGRPAFFTTSYNVKVHLSQ